MLRLLIEYGNEQGSNNKLPITQVSSETVKQITGSEGELKLSKVQLKKKISQKGRKKPGRTIWQEAHRSLYARAVLCRVCLIGFCIVSWERDPPPREFGLEMFLSNIHQRLWEKGALTMLPWVKCGPFRFSETTGQRWELQHDQN